MHTHTEHQQHDADLGELGGETDIWDISRRERADRDARQQIADNRRQIQANRRKSADKSERQPTATVEISETSCGI